MGTVRLFPTNSTYTRINDVSSADPRPHGARPWVLPCCFRAPASGASPAYTARVCTYATLLTSLMRAALVRERSRALMAQCDTAMSLHPHRARERCFCFGLFERETVFIVESRRQKKKRKEKKMFPKLKKNKERKVHPGSDRRPLICSQMLYD